MVSCKIKKNIIYGLILIILLSFVTTYVSAQEIEQEPEPPQIPEPSPKPEPIKLPEPEPIPSPFPRETDSEKIRRLIEENDKLKQQNLDFQGQIIDLKQQNAHLETKIIELNDFIKNLNEIITEQIKVIMTLLSKL
jgi:hypothetical protein